MNTSHIEALLEEKIGLDAGSIGTMAITQAVRGRIEAHALPDIEAYWKLLSLSELEQQELVEAVVVPETWFFRDREAFAALAGIARGNWAAAPSVPLRILSLPCSTGEEPFSMAMALLDAGFSQGHFQIDAVDISARAIARAQRGVYGKNSFRGTDLGFRERYFERVALEYHLSEQVRAQVSFRQSNLFSPGAFPSVRIYDVIFCRNVLIYFDRPAQKRAVELLAGLLKPAGVLFVGPAEAASMADYGSAHPTGSIPPPHPIEDWVEQAQSLADQGKLAEAMEYCERHLRHEPPSAQAFYLLGLIHDAGGEPRRAAERLMERARRAQSGGRT